MRRYFDSFLIIALPILFFILSLNIINLSTPLIKKAWCDRRIDSLECLNVTSQSVRKFDFNPKIVLIKNGSSEESFSQVIQKIGTPIETSGGSNYTVCLLNDYDFDKNECLLDPNERISQIFDDALDEISHEEIEKYEILAEKLEKERQGFFGGALFANIIATLAFFLYFLEKNYLFKSSSKKSNSEDAIG